jgi:hypothetical protein
MSYKKSRFAVSVVSTVVALSFLLYLVLSAQVAMSLMPAVGIGGFYAQIDSFSGNTGELYPEYTNAAQYNTQVYPHTVQTSTPACDAVPMAVVELTGEASAIGFSLTKDIEIPFITGQFLRINITDSDSDPLGLTGENLKLFVTQLGGDSLLVRNIVLNESKSTTDKWGPDSGEFYLRGGQEAEGDGLVGTDIEGWLHGIEGTQVTLERGVSSVNIQLEYPTETEVNNFYDSLFGYDHSRTFRSTQDENPEFGTASRVDRADAAGTEGYMTCSP